MEEKYFAQHLILKKEVKNILAKNESCRRWSTCDWRYSLLNDKLTESIPKELKYKIYISALTILNIDYYNRISTTDSRLIRRMVRDYNFRGYTAIHTLQIWNSVNNGENQYIFPYQDEADSMFNTSLIYELCVLKNMHYQCWKK